MSISPPTVLDRCFETLQVFYSWSEDMHVLFTESFIFIYLFIYFLFFYLFFFFFFFFFFFVFTFFYSFYLDFLLVPSF